VLNYLRAFVRCSEMIATTIDAFRGSELQRASTRGVMLLSSTCYATRLAFTRFTQVANTKAGIADFGFGYVWKDWIPDTCN